MRWYRHIDKDIRFRNGYLFVPRCNPTEEGTMEWRWLEQAKWKQREVEIARFDEFGMYSEKVWVNSGWIDDEGDNQYDI